MSVKDKLESDFGQNRLYNSYLISSDDLDKALDEIIIFLDNIFPSEQEILQHPDVCLIRKELDTAKAISVDQIRELGAFLSKTSVISGFKVGIIYEAELMNANASNACLKMLEDSPDNTLLVLLCRNSLALLPTIRSRCSKINHYYSKHEAAHDEDLLRILSIGSATERVDFINKFAKKDRSSWLEFAEKIQLLISRFAKKAASLNIELSDYEEKIWQKFPSKNVGFFENKYQQATTLIHDTKDFDLELRSATLLLISILHKK